MVESRSVNRWKGSQPIVWLDEVDSPCRSPSGSSRAPTESCFEGNWEILWGRTECASSSRVPFSCLLFFRFPKVFHAFIFVFDPITFYQVLTHFRSSRVSRRNGAPPLHARVDTRSRRVSNWVPKGLCAFPPIPAPYPSSCPWNRYRRRPC